MTTISQIENILISTIRNLNIFRIVDSAGRNGIPLTISHPAAFLYFVSDRDTGTNPRPVYELEYDIIVMNKNLRSEGSAADDTYSILDAVRNAINKKTLGIANIEPFTIVSREITDAADSVITYKIKVKTRQYLPVPTA